MSDSDAAAAASPASPSSVKETAVADVQLNDNGAPSQVNEYRVLTQLGEGTTSKVYHCTDDDGHEFALKILNKSFLKRKREYKKIDGKMVLSNAFQKVQKEVAIMKKLSHDNLVKLHEIIDSPEDDKMVLVLELITGGQVMKWEDKGFRYCCPRSSSGVLSPDDARRCMRDVIDALDYLHQNFICHRDIKPENILLAGVNTYKLADFGVAHMLDDSGEKRTLRNTEGTYHFLAPECTTGNLYDPYSVDIWALGVTMFTLLFGALPFGTKAASLTEVMDSIRVDPLVLDSEAIDPDCESILRAMMTKDPDERITIEELRRHPWLSRDAIAPRPEPSRVEVTNEEIEAAFTPVNNFILMVRIKMKMAGRLARARNSIDIAKQSQSPKAASEPESEVRSAAATWPYALPVLASPSKFDTPENGTSSAKGTSPGASTTTSPSSSPAKAAITMFTRRLSLVGDGNSPPPKAHDANATGGADQYQPWSSVVGFSKRRSSMNDNLVIEEPVWEDSMTSHASPRANTDNHTGPKDLVTEADGFFMVRAPPRRTSMLNLSAELRLPKLEISSACSSPATSPLSSPVHRRLISRFSRENLDTRSDDSTEETEAILKSPTDKHNRMGELRQSIVRPVPPANADSPTVDAQEDDDKVSSNIALVSPLPLPKPHRKTTHDEVKAAIVGIVHRTTTDCSSPSTSPVKQSSASLHRQTSSTTEAAYHPNSSNLDAEPIHHQGSAPLPMLVEQSKQPQWESSTSSKRKSPLTPTSKDSERNEGPSRSAAFSKYPEPRVRYTECSNRSERSMCSNGCATSNAIEHIASTVLDRDTNDSDSDVTDGAKATAARGLKLGDGSSTIRGYKVEAEASANRADDDYPVESVEVEDSKVRTSSRRGGANTSSELFGVLRRSSTTNVVGETTSSIDANSRSASRRNRKDATYPHSLPSTASPVKLSSNALGRGDSSTDSPTDQELPPGLSSVRRKASNHRSILDSQDTIRLLLVRRSESVKALLTGIKSEKLQHPSACNAMLADLPRSQSLIKSPETPWPRRTRNGSVPSATCAIQ